MLFPVLKSVHYVALYLFLGGPAFWYLMWRPAVSAKMPEESKLLYDRIKVGLIVGAAFFVLSGLGDALRAASQVIDMGDWALVVRFLTTSRFGKFTLLKIGATVVTVLCFHFAGRKGRGILPVAGAVSGIVLLVFMSQLNHLAGKPGIMPVISDVVHLLASIIWAGGVFFLAIAPWQTIRAGSIAAARQLRALVERFTNVALIAVGVVAATGAFASFLLVYSPLALQRTNYGTALIVKVALFLAVMAFAGANFLLVAPGLRRAEKAGEPSIFRRSVGRLARYTRVEAVVLVGLLVAAGVLTTLPPADTFNEIKQTSWQLEAGDHLVAVLMFPTGIDSPGEVQLSIRVEDAQGQPAPDGTTVVVNLDMLSHAMGIPPIQAEQVNPGRYRAKALISMAGPWISMIDVTTPDGEIATASFDFQAAQGARSVGQTRRFDFRAVTFSQGRLMRLIIGVVWMGMALYGIMTSRQGRLPRWVTPVSVLALGLSGYLLFTATLVDAYPTAYIRSPIPFEERTVDGGRKLFADHCAVCHGPEGLGDGELAPTLDPAPDDLSEAHVDDHTDGEIFWWVTHGIPVSGMPGVGTALSEEERWQLVMFVRSIRWPVPQSAGH